MRRAPWLSPLVKGSLLFVLGGVRSSAASDLSQSEPVNYLAQAAAAGELDRAASLLDAEERDDRDEYDRDQQLRREVAERLVTEGRAYVRLARPGLLVLSLGLEKFLRRASRLERLRRSIARDLQRQTDLNRRVVELGERLLALRQQRGPLSAAQLARLNERSAISDAKERALAFERAFSARADNHTAVYAAKVPFGGPLRSAERFTQMKGHLPFPVTGRTEILLAKRRGGGGPGLELRARPGTAVQSVFQGRVVFADRYADYGQTVIVDHGEGYFTVSAGLDTPRVHVGQDVTVGTTLGTVADQGNVAGLYFEIRFTGEPVDPSEWFGI
jgi:murein hydrolase activator